MHAFKELDFIEIFVRGHMVGHLIFNGAQVENIGKHGLLPKLVIDGLGRESDLPGFSSDWPLVFLADNGDATGRKPNTQLLVRALARNKADLQGRETVERGGPSRNFKLRADPRDNVVDYCNTLRAISADPRAMPVAVLRLSGNFNGGVSLQALLRAIHRKGHHFSEVDCNFTRSTKRRLPGELEARQAHARHAILARQPLVAQPALPPRHVREHHPTHKHK